MIKRVLKSDSGWRPETSPAYGRSLIALVHHSQSGCQRPSEQPWTGTKWRICCPLFFSGLGKGASTFAVGDLWSLGCSRLLATWHSITYVGVPGLLRWTCSRLQLKYNPLQIRMKDRERPRVLGSSWCAPLSLVWIQSIARSWRQVRTGRINRSTGLKSLHCASIYHQGLYV